MTIADYPKISTTGDDVMSTVQPLLVSAMLEDCAGGGTRKRGMKKTEEQVEKKRNNREIRGTRKRGENE
jgi:hypothetical protein